MWTGAKSVELGLADRLWFGGVGGTGCVQGRGHPRLHGEAQFCREICSPLGASYRQPWRGVLDALGGQASLR